MSGPSGLLRYWMLRSLEDLLPVDVLYRTLLPVATLRAALRPPFRNLPKALPLPDCFGPNRCVPVGKLRRRMHYLNQTVELFPDRLGTPRWNRRCQIIGMEHLQQARRLNRPVLLAFCHLGPFTLIRFWLRAAGVPAASLVRGNLTDRPLIKRLTDRLSPFADIPTAIYQDDLPRAIRFLRTGNPLLVAVDREAGKQLDVPLQNGWSFRLATGAIRLAISQDAELIPCTIIDEGSWHFRIEMAAPVPREWLIGKNNWMPAAKYLVDRLFPHIRNHPEQYHGLRDSIRLCKENQNTHCSRE